MLRIGLDCDPGFDDWFTWLLLEREARRGRLKLESVTITHGNAPFETVFTNAQAIQSLHGLATPIYRGASYALNQKQVTAQTILGSDGMRSVGLKLPRASSITTAAEVHGSYMSGAQASSITWLCTGPLTTMAKRLASLIEPSAANTDTDANASPSAPIKIVWMGGSTDRGNHTPAAEFNAIADPEAAQAVFRAADLNHRVHVTMIGLNVCRPVEFNQHDLMALRGTLERSAEPNLSEDLMAKKTFLDYLDGYQRIRSTDGSIPMSIYDPTALVALLHPDWFVFKSARVQVECRGLYTQGMTVVDFKSPYPNALVATDVNAPAVKNWLMERLTFWLLEH